MKAAAEITRRTGNKNITGIQFEDGSGDKYNYQIAGHQEWHYLNLGTQWSVQHQADADQIRESIKYKNHKDFKRAVSRYIHAYNDDIGKFHDIIVDHARQEGKDDITNELFNG